MWIDKALGKLLNDKLDLRARVFILLALIGATVSAVLAIVNIFIGAGWGNVLGCVASFLLAIGLLRYISRTGRTLICYRISILVIFLTIFPLMFFTGGGYHSGMPSFFVFAVIFTGFMLEGMEMYLTVVFEVVFYSALCLVAWRVPETVSAFPSEQEVVIDIIVGFVASSLFLSIAMLMTFRLYRQTQRELSEKNAVLERLDRLKTEFLGNIAHELKTPIAVMMGIAQNTRRQAFELGNADELIVDLGVLASENARLGLLVEQILDATRIDEGRMVCDPCSVSVEEIVQTTVNAYYSLLKKNGNQFEIRIEDDLPKVWSDSRRVSQVLINLLQNATRHTCNGKITLSAAADADFAVVTVDDTGEGIAPERLPYLFERYKSRDGAGKRVENDTGSGLGLYICRHIVEAHGGNITVESALNKGTSIRFTLPLAHTKTRENT